MTSDEMIRAVYPNMTVAYPNNDIRNPVIVGQCAWLSGVLTYGDPDACSDTDPRNIVWVGLDGSYRRSRTTISWEEWNDAV